MAVYTSNRTVLDLSKVQHGTFFYRNQFGRRFNKKVTYPSVDGKHISKDEIAAYHNMYPGETMRERAARLDIVDVFTPVVVFQLTANHSITYTGEKAKSLWREWQSRIFGEKK